MPIDSAGQFYLDSSPKQLEIVSSVVEKSGKRKYIFVNGPKWTGKCVSPDTIVYTANGPVPISLLGSAEEGQFSTISEVVASLFIDRNQILPATASQFYNSGLKKANEIITDMGYGLTCSPHHPIWCEHNGEIKYRTSEEISELLIASQDVWLPLMRGNPLGWGKQCDIEPDMAYALGVLVGDGCYTKKAIANFRVSFTSADESIVSSVRDAITKRFPECIIKHVSRYDYAINCPAFRRFITSLGMAGKYAHEKEVPEFVFRSTKAVIVAFLQGLFDTDGTVCSRGSISYCSSSPRLAKQVQDLLLCLGVRSARTFKSNYARGAWQVFVREEDDFANRVGFRLQRKQSKIGSVKRRFKVSWSAYPPSFRGALRRLYETRKSRNVGEMSRYNHRRVIHPVLRGRALSAKLIKPIADLIQCWNEPEFQKFWISGEVWWDRVKSVTKTESLLVDLTVPETSNFVGNGFINHNTVGCLDAVVAHAWETEHARVCVVAFTIGAGDDSGVWSELTEKTVPRWIDGNFGLQWWDDGKSGKQKKLGPKQKGASKKLYFDITNKHPCRKCKGTGQFESKRCPKCHGCGRGKSHIELESLKDEQEIEANFFNRYYTMIYWGELQHYKQRLSFDTLIQSLRVDGVKDDDSYVLLCDGNPSDLGEDAWQYKLWFQFRIDPKAPDELKPLQSNLKLIMVMMDDNPYLTPERKSEIAASYNHDPDLKDRYILGLWKKSASDALFASAFRPSFHVISHDADGDAVELVPEPNCTKLICGWDPGGANPAMVISEKCYRRAMKADGTVIIDPSTKEPAEESVFKFIDEVAYVKDNLSVSEFTEIVLERILFWESFIGHEIEWQHWSDNTALTQTEAISKRTVYDEVFAVSQGKIVLEASDALYRFGKGLPTNRPGTIAQGIRLWRKLLFTRRLLFCKWKTPKLILMNQSLKRKPKTTDDIIATNDKNRHIFDAGRYLTSRECYEELQDMIIDINRPQTVSEKPNIISIPL